MKTALVCGAGGFIGSHLVNRLAGEGCRSDGIALTCRWVESRVRQAPATAPVG